MTERVTLHTATRSGIDAAEAVNAAASLLADSATAFVSSPREWFAARLSGGQLRRMDESPAPLDSAFDLRFFNGIREVRWRRTPDGGHAALLTLDGAPIPTGWNVGETIEGEALQRRYLLWGSVDDTRHGWAVVRESRIGRLPIPVATTVDRDDVLALTALEVLVTNAALDGMAEIRHEILTGITKEDRN